MKTPAQHLFRMIAMPTFNFSRWMRTRATAWLGALALCWAMLMQAQPANSLCARVKIVILQELTLERVGFEATLEVTNNDGEDPITDFTAQLTFENPALSTGDQPNDASPLFFVRTPTIENISAVDGSGVIGPTKKAVVKWFIIPKITAGGRDPNGIRYKVGCTLAGRMRGVQIPAEVLFAIADDIYVKPEPQLEITYFQPREVFGDDPFTPAVESPVPFTLGVLVKNSGFGPARKLQINSQQPKIVENKQGLLLIAQLLGARVNDSALDNASLLVNLGDIPPSQARKGAWDMVTSLSGEFIEFKATYTHASELGGEETSVIKSLNAYFMEHEVLNDQPGRDNLLEFLADTDNDTDRIPDAMFESEGNVMPVNHLTDASTVSAATPAAPFPVNVHVDREGWGFIRLSDPGQAKYQIASVVRSDGKVLNAHNYWVNRHYSLGFATDVTYLNILDLVALQDYTYTVTYAQPQVDIVAPVTSIHFSGEVSQKDGKYYITPDTQIYFITEDASRVEISYSLDGDLFRPAYPFQVRVPGEHTLDYYAEDAAANMEEIRSAIVVVTTSGPSVTQFSEVAGSVFVPGGALSVRPDTARFTYAVQPGPTPVDARFDIFQGGYGWVRVGRVPVSPTAATSTALLLEGNHVDYFRYRLDGGAWSAEAPNTGVLSLSGLGAGAHTVEVLGRPNGGTYPPAGLAASVSWVVDPTAPATRVSGVPSSPTLLGDAALTVGGSGVTAYRWTVDDGFVRPATPVANPINLTLLGAGEHTVKVFGQVGGVEQPAPSIVRWTVDPAYGSDYATLRKVRTLSLPSVASGTQTFTWDGHDDLGVVVEPGLYTVRLTLSDRLGRTSYFTRLVRLGQMAGATQALAGAERGPRNPYARGRYAVWQDQSDGTSQIYAQDIVTAGATIRQITTGTRANENARTDGRYVVWQARQADGNWDIQIKDLLNPTVISSVTATPSVDETNPSVDWPWVVYQARPAANPSAPPQIHAINLVTHLEPVVWPGPLEQTDPDVQAGRVVWQDQRDVGQGEIYFRNLETGEQRRLTENEFGQYHPAIYGNMVAWQDNRNGQVDIYGYDLLRNTEVRITDTSENEARPYLDGSWLVCEEDSLGPLTGNLRLVHLPSLRAVPLTRSTTAKTRAALASGVAVWQDAEGTSTRLATATLPALQGVFQDQNAVVITATMATYQQTAFNLLRQWNAQAGVTSITRYTSLVPAVVAQTATFQGGALSGDDFPLVAGSFLWVRFDQRQLLDLGLDSGAPVNMSPGVNVLTHTRFPNGYTSFQLLRQLGLTTANAVRMLDAENGRWVVAEVRLTPPPEGGLPVPTPVGIDFRIPNVAVLFVELAANVNQWKPQ